MKKKKGKEEPRLFKVDLPVRTIGNKTEFYRHLKKLIEQLSALNECISVVNDLNNKEILQYFSKLYDVLLPTVSYLVSHIVKDNLAGIDDRIDNDVFNVEAILGYSKVLKDRYYNISSRSTKNSEEITIDCIKDKLNKLWILENRCTQN